MNAADPNPEPSHGPSESTLILGQDPSRADGAPKQTQPMPRSVETQQMLAPPQPSFEMPVAPPQRFPICCWVAVGSSLCSLVLAGLLWFRPAPTAPPAVGTVPAPAASAAPVAASAGSSAPAPAALKPYIDAAQAGDTHAMRMLGAMYYHGLDLPRNRQEGLKWYRKAAESGSKVAQEELRQLE